MVDVNLGDEIAGGRGEIGGEIVLAGLGLGAATVGEAEAVMLGMGGQAAHASIGEGESAEVEGIGWSRVRHGESIAKKYYNVKILLCTDTTFFRGVFEYVVEKWRSCGKVHSRQLTVRRRRAGKREGKSKTAPLEITRDAAPRFCGSVGVSATRPPLVRWWAIRGRAGDPPFFSPSGTGNVSSVPRFANFHQIFHLGHPAVVNSVL